MSLLNEALAHLNSQRYPEALLAAQKAARVGKPDSTVQQIIGIAAFQLADWPTAERAFRQTTMLLPTNAESWNNLALTQLQLKQPEAAEQTYTRLFALSPTADNAYMLAVVQHELGRQADALASITAALEKFPTDPRFRFMRYVAMLISSAYPQWPALWQQLGDFAPDRTQNTILQFDKLIYAWLTAQPTGQHMQACETALQELDKLGSAGNDFIAEKRRKTLQGHTGYHNMFKALVGTPPPADNPALPELYMLGDSHTLPPHNQVVTFGGQQYQLKNRLVIGIKAWHLAQPQNNPHRAGFTGQLAALPADAPVLISIGEIDCRPDEGIFPLARRTGKGWQKLAESTFAAAATYIAKQAGKRQVTAAGVPAPQSSLLAQVPKAEQSDYLAFIRYANDYCLRQAAKQHGWAFLDLHALTTNAEGASNGRWSLDGTHLQPAALTEAFKNHLTA